MNHSTNKIWIKSLLTALILAGWCYAGEGTRGPRPRGGGGQQGGGPQGGGERPRPPGPPTTDQFFKRFDLDKDDAVTLEEFLKGHAKPPPRPENPEGAAPAGTETGAGKNQEQGGGDNGRPKPPSRAEMFDRLDENGDGVLSREEFEEMRLPPGPPPGPPNLEEFFKHLDQNGDGKVTREEHEAARKQGPPRGQGNSGKKESQIVPGGGY